MGQGAKLLSEAFITLAVHTSDVFVLVRRSAKLLKDCNKCDNQNAKGVKGKENYS